MSGISAYMPWFVGDYLRDTAHLEAHEHGAYLLLMAHAWQHDGALPLDHERLRKISKLSETQWKSSELTLMEFWKKNGVAYRQKRIDVELRRAKASYEQKVKAGKSRAYKRTLSERSTDAKRALSESESESQILTTKSKSIAPNGAHVFVDILVNLGADVQAVNDWIKVRKAKRAPLTQSVVDALIREAAIAKVSVADAVSICAARSWQGFKASWVKPEDRKEPEDRMGKFVI